MVSWRDAVVLKAALGRRMGRGRREAQQARERHEAWLMSLPNVNGISLEEDPATKLAVIVVFVARKVPRERLGPGETIPAEIDGVPVRVMEIGPVSAQEDPRSTSD